MGRRGAEFGLVDGFLFLGQDCAIGDGCKRLGQTPEERVNS